MSRLLEEQIQLLIILSEMDGGNVLAKNRLVFNTVAVRCHLFLPFGRFPLFFFCETRHRDRKQLLAHLFYTKRQFSCIHSIKFNMYMYINMYNMYISQQQSPQGTLYCMVKTLQ